jgi:hypothetical protein
MLKLPWDKKLISLRLREDLIKELDTLRPLTQFSSRTEMFEHGMSVYIAYVYHQLKHNEGFE